MVFADGCQRASDAGQAVAPAVRCVVVPRVGWPGLPSGAARSGPAGWGKRGDEGPGQGKIVSWVPCRAARQQAGLGSGLRCRAAGSGPSSRFRVMTALPSCCRTPPGWPGCSPRAGAAGLAWARAGPAEARSALPGCAGRMRACSPVRRREAGGCVASLVPHGIGHERAWHARHHGLRRAGGVRGCRGARRWPAGCLAFSGCAWRSRRIRRSGRPPRPAVPRPGARGLGGVA
jgi:hypothetical protein